MRHEAGMVQCRWQGRRAVAAGTLHRLSSGVQHTGGAGSTMPSDDKNWINLLELEQLAKPLIKKLVRCCSPARQLLHKCTSSGWACAGSRLLCVRQRVGEHAARQQGSLCKVASGAKVCWALNGCLRLMALSSPLAGAWWT